MKKISKKIVSLVTLAAFALTLVPAAAFAEVGKVDDSTAAVSPVSYNTAKITIDLGKTDVAEADNYIVWATNDSGVVPQNATTGVNYGAETGTDIQIQNWTGADGKAENAVVLAKVADTENPATVTVNATFATPGKYTLHAALNEKDATSLEDAAVKEIAVKDAEFTAYGPADAKYSGYGVVKNGAVEEAATVDVDEVLETSFVVNYAYKQGTNDALKNVKVWAVEQGDNKDEESSFVTFDGEKGHKDFTSVTNEDPAKVEVTFAKTGTYVLYASANDGNDDLQYRTVVTVNDKDATIDTLKVEANTNNVSTPKNIVFQDGMGKLDLVTFDKDFGYDGIDTVTLTGYAYDENGDPVQGKTITATTSKDSVVEFDKDENNVVTATTDNFGKFTVSFKMTDKANATVTLSNEDDGISYTVQIVSAKTSAKDINRTLTDGYVLAGNDSKYAETVYGSGEDVYLTDAVQFEVLDEKEDAVTGPIAGCKVDLRDKTPDSDMQSGDLEFVWDKDNSVYTLAYVGKNAKEDLVPGKYEVRVALPSGDHATVTFNVAKFGKVEDTVLDLKASDYDQSPANPNEAWMSVDDTITLGQTVVVNAKYVDGNGIKVPATGVSYNFIGKAVVDASAENNVFGTMADIPANESLIGTTVKVVAFNSGNKQLVEKTLTVADSYTDKSLEFSADQGPISKDNKVTVSVVNEDGKVQQVNGKVSAWVVDQSNEDAKVSVDTTKNTVSNGKATLTVYSDQETTADIVVVVEAGTEAYYGTLEYTFGSEDALANRTVVMTIGSTDYVVNNNIITGDAAPYVDSNWRTMVPIRALAESFDAEVIWNQDDSTVTINFDGDTQIVMTVGETAYTVDGVEAEMDTEPVNTGDRVYVPIRFAAEGLGFGVTPLYDDAGLTASVVFQR